MRSLVERLSRDRILRRRMPRELGGATLLVSPDSAMRYWRRDLRRVDAPLFDLARELVRPAAAVWDIGANVGLFAAAASFLAGRDGTVLAVEADGWLADLLRRSAAGLGPDHAPVEVLSAAVAEAPGIAEFCVSRRGRAASHLASVAGSTQTGGARMVQKVVTLTLDSLLDWFPTPQLIKLDVEGAEAKCLLGAGQLLSRHRPTLLCEVADENAASVGKLFFDHGYKLYDASQPPGRREPLAVPAWNSIAVPPR